MRNLLLTACCLPFLAISACETAQQRAPEHAVHLTLEFDLHEGSPSAVVDSNSDSFAPAGLEGRCKPAFVADAPQAVIKRAIAILHVRLQMLGISGAAIAPCGPSRICLTARGHADPSRLMAAVSRRGRVEVRLLDDAHAGFVDNVMLPPGVTLTRAVDRVGKGDAMLEVPYLLASDEAAILGLPAERVPSDSTLMVGEVVDERTRQYKGFRSWLVRNEVSLAPEKFRNIRTYRHRLQGCYVHLEFTNADADQLRGLTRGRRAALLLDGRVNGAVLIDPDRCGELTSLDVCLGAANLCPPVPPGRAATFEDARVLEALLESGQLPAPVAIVEMRAQ